jgi:hypothetical protein
MVWGGGCIHNRFTILFRNMLLLPEKVVPGFWVFGIISVMKEEVGMNSNACAVVWSVNDPSRERATPACILSVSLFSAKRYISCPLTVWFWRVSSLIRKKHYGIVFIEDVKFTLQLSSQCPSLYNDKGPPPKKRRQREGKTSFHRRSIQNRTNCSKHWK